MKHHAANSFNTNSPSGPSLRIALFDQMAGCSGGQAMCTFGTLDHSFHYDGNSKAVCIKSYF